MATKILILSGFIQYELKMVLKDFDRELISQKIENFIKEKFDESGANKLIIGLSGGLDSSVTASLCKRAVGTDDVLGVALPVKASSRSPKKIAEFLGINFEEIDLGGIFLELIDLLKNRCDHFSEQKLALGNLKARLRMIILYYHSNALDGLVVGTGNKSELTIGYFTKFGDGAADIFPIGDLYKTQVREMAKYLDLPDEIIEKKPSAGLWEGQTDEAEIGYSYSEIDETLDVLKENGISVAREKFDDELVNDLLEMKKESHHKREKPSICEVF